MGVRLDLLRFARKLVRRAGVLLHLALRHLVDELEVRVRDDRLLEVGVDPGAPAAVGPDQLELHPGAVVALPVDGLFLQDVRLVLAGVDAQLDPPGLATLPGLRKDDQGLAGGEHRVKTRSADADPLLAPGLLQPVELRAVEELREDLRNLLLDDAGAVVLDADPVPILGDFDDVDAERRQDPRLFAGIEGVVDGLFDGREEGLGGVVEPE